MGSAQSITQLHHLPPSPPPALDPKLAPHLSAVGSLQVCISTQVFSLHLAPTRAQQSLNTTVDIQSARMPLGPPFCKRGFSNALVKSQSDSQTSGAMALAFSTNCNPDNSFFGGPSKNSSLANCNILPCNAILGDIHSYNMLYLMNMSNAPM